MEEQELEEQYGYRRRHDCRQKYWTSHRHIYTYRSVVPQNITHIQSAAIQMKEKDNILTIEIVLKYNSNIMPTWNILLWLFRSFSLSYVVNVYNVWINVKWGNILYMMFENCHSRGSSLWHGGYITKYVSREQLNSMGNLYSVLR